MVDLSQTIAPKSDQLTADDLASGPITVTITAVTAGEADQPVNISIGRGHKPFRPCKSMRRVLVQVWGNEGTTYVGKSFTLYRDANVKFGGASVGGIRISHMSHIEKQVQLSLISTKGKRALFTVKPLKVPVQSEVERREEQQPANADAPLQDRAAEYVATTKARIEEADSEDALRALTSDPAYARGVARLRETRPELAADLDAAISGALAKFDPFAADAA